MGLTAPQVGVSRRAFCMDVSGHPKAGRNHGLVLLFDPELLATEGGEVRREGCMSVPDFTANVRRGLRAVVRGTDPGGDERVLETEGIEARAVQHEIVTSTGC